MDRQSIEDFETGLRNNLYKIWNRMSSGTYLPPPVMAVEIPKPNGGGTRILGVPTVADRVAQTVAAMTLEPRTESIFHDDSYGYRPRRSALDVVGRTRRRLAAELISELVGVDKKIKAANKELTELVDAVGSSLQELNGIGPSGAARLIGDIGDIHRFASRGHFASWNGTAPIDASSGDQRRHHLSRAGNRRINRVLHIMAVVQLRHDTEGRAYTGAGSPPARPRWRPCGASLGKYRCRGQAGLGRGSSVASRDGLVAEPRDGQF